jgi:hypothetical protein
MIKKILGGIVEDKLLTLLGALLLIAVIVLYVTKVIDSTLFYELLALSGALILGKRQWIEDIIKNLKK